MWTALVAASVVVLGMNTLVLGILLPVLAPLLSEVCGTDRRARFWLVFIGTVTSLACAVAALFSLPSNVEAITEVSLEQLVFGAVRWTSVSLVLSWCAIGAILASFMPRN